MFSSTTSSSLSLSSSKTSESGIGNIESGILQFDDHLCHYCGKTSKTMLCYNCELAVRTNNVKDITLDINLFGCLITKLYDYTLSTAENQHIDKLVEKVYYKDG